MSAEEDANVSQQGSEKSCWNCIHQDITRQDTFLGICTWFSKHGRTDKLIPPDKVDAGCNHFEQKVK